MDLLSYLLGRNSVKPSPAPTPEPSLPSGYTKVNYIASNGTQYIDTRYKVNANTKIEIKCSQIRSYGGVVFGARETIDEATIIYALGSSSGKVNFYYDSTRVNSGLDTGVFTDVVIDNLTGVVTFNGTPSSPVTINSYPDLNLVLFAQFQDNELTANSHSSIGTFKIYENNVLIHHYIPCYRNSDSEVGFYDVIAEEFVTNDGTGDFTYIEDYS